MIRLTESGIEYLDYAWNLSSGCTHGDTGICPVGHDCWARTITEKFPEHYPNGFTPTVYPETFEEPLKLKKTGLRIGVVFMGDLFQDCIDPEMTSFEFYKGGYTIAFTSGQPLHFMTLREIVFRTISLRHQDTFIFLTKNPRGALRWGKFPDNCWFGITLTYPNPDALYLLEQVDARVKFLSVEPMFADFSRVNLKGSCVNWVIIGAATGGRKSMENLGEKHPGLNLMSMVGKWSLQPPTPWVKELVEKADSAGIKVFLKNNLKQSLKDFWPNDPWAFMNGYYTSEEHPNVDRHLRQEYPVAGAVART